jgi:hypothetical protein
MLAEESEGEIPEMGGEEVPVAITKLFHCKQSTQSIIMGSPRET